MSTQKNREREVRAQVKRDVGWGPKSKCGACVAGVVLDHLKGIQRCDDCNLFEDDHHAALALFEMWTFADSKTRKKFHKAAEQILKRSHYSRRGKKS